MAKPAGKSDEASKPSAAEKQVRISQSDVPSYGLSDALRIPRAIADNYAGRSTKPLDLAMALNMSPNSSTFRMLTGASIAYGLTEGGYNAATISLTSLATRITSPLEEHDDLVASREALQRPRILGEFLKTYDGKPIPKDDIAANVVAAMGVPKERAAEIFKLIVDEATKLGLISELKGRKYVNLQSSTASSYSTEPVDEKADLNSDSSPDDFSDRSSGTSSISRDSGQPRQDTRRVFITHGKNKEFVDPIKRLLTFGELIPIVSVESQSVSQPVPEKVMADMRSCSAAIIHVATEQVLIDKDANEHAVLNPNVLIEIGAAMALYGKRFILLVRDGVKLPSNLQGLYEVR